MNGASSQDDAISEVAAALDGAHRILVAAHRNPDGDAIGSLLGLTHLLRDRGKSPVAYCPDGMPRKLAFLPGATSVVGDVANERFDASVLLDTPDTGLFPAGFPAPDRRGVFVVIDHHSRYEPLGDAVLRMNASAVGEVLYHLAETADWTIGDDAAECLYTAIVSDTSSFKYKSATPESHRVAAALLERGDFAWEVASHLFESFTIARQRLLAEVLGTLTVSLEGRFASLCCTREMMRAAGASNGDLDGMVNNARAIEGVVLAALLRETDNGTVRVSLRSKGGVDAAKVAAHLGGGGHINAGGAYLESTTVADALERVMDAAAQELPSPV